MNQNESINLLIYYLSFNKTYQKQGILVSKIIQLKFKMIQCTFAEIKDGAIIITKQAKELLETLNETVFISLIGQPKSGKTQLIKRITAEQNSHNKSTGEPLILMTVLEQKSTNPSHPDCEIILLELINQDQLQNQWESRVNGLLFLISSIIIYNTKGTISQQNIHSLSNIISSFQSILLDPLQLGQQFVFPTLYWVLRDFDASECVQLSKEYMQKSLDLQKGFSQSIQKINRPKRNIRAYFKDRDCFMLNHPDLKCEQYRSFGRQVLIMKDKMLTRARPLYINGKKANGKILNYLSSYITKLINDDKKINLCSILGQIREDYNQNLLQNLLESIETSVITQKTQRASIVSIKQLKKNVCQPILVCFQKDVMGSIEQSKLYHKHLVQKIEEKFENIVQTNRKLWQKYYQQLYNQIAIKTLSKASNNKQLQVLLQLIKEQVVVTSQQYQDALNIIESIEGKWLKMNLVKIVDDFVQQEKNTSQIKYQQIVDYNTSCIQISSKIRENLESKIQDYDKLLEINQRQIGELKDFIDVKQQENYEINKTVSQLEGTIQSLKSQLSKIIQECKIKTEQLELVTVINRQNNIQIMRLNEEVKKLQILSQRNDTEMKTSNLEKDKIELKFIQMNQQLDQVTMEKNKLVATIQKQILKNQKLNIANIKQKQEIKKQQSLIQSQRIQLQEISSTYELANKRLQMKVNQLKANLQEHQDSGFKTIETLKNNLKAEIDRLRIIEQENKKINKQNSLMRKQIQKLHNQSEQDESLIQIKISKNNLFTQSIQRQKENICPKKSNNSSNLKIKIKRTLIRQQNNKPYTVYEIQVSSQTKSWMVYKKYKQLCELHSQLKDTYKNIQLSQVSFIVSPQQLPQNKKPLTSQNRKKLLQSYLNDIATNKDVILSKVFQSFIQEKGNSSMQKDAQFNRMHNLL